MIRAEVLVSGIVQGVGYRWFAVKRADELRLTGTVENLISGEVYVVAEGDEKEIAKFIELLKSGPSRAQVLDVAAKFADYVGEYQSFEIIGR